MAALKDKQAYEELVIATITITKKAELRHFQIALPANAKAITSLWYKIRVPNGADILTAKGKSTYLPMLSAAKLSLSAYGREGVFFFGNLFMDNMNAGYLDYTTEFFKASPYTRLAYRRPLKVKIDHNTSIVSGGLLDNLGVVNGTNVEYDVDIYLTVLCIKTDCKK